METSPQKQPNILFLFPDQWRWDWLGCAGYDVQVRTPNIDALAARGVRFTQCRTNSPVCAPARACLALGVRYEKCGVPSNGYDTDPNRATVFNLLRDAGYRTATTGKNDLHKKTKWKGLDGWTQLLGRYGFTEARDHSGKMDAVSKRGESPHCSYTSLLAANGLMQMHVADYDRRKEEATWATSVNPSPLPRRFYTDDVTGQNTVEMIQNFPQEGPWLMWANFPGPHDPMDPPRELQERYDDVDFAPPVNGQSTHRDKPVDHPQLRRNYAAEIEGIDEWVGWILDAVEQRGELDNTLVIFASDHGEMLGDHGRYTKSCGYEGAVHVPLIVAGPGVREGAVSDALIELIDITATMMEAAQLPIPAGWDARSFGPLLRGETEDTSHREIQLSSLADWKMAFDGRWKLVEYENAPPSLYDLQNDPYETQDLAAENTDEVKRLSQFLI